jgi:hypothetical protein
VVLLAAAQAQQQLMGLQRQCQVRWHQLLLLLLQCWRLL